MNPLTANSLWYTSAFPGYLKWHLATTKVAQIQQHKLQAILAHNANTAFGKAHGFNNITNPQQFQSKVAIRDYQAYRPFIQNITAGLPNILTASPIRRFGVTSGSSGPYKLIPYTDQLLTEFQSGINPWVARLFASHPRLLTGRVYWSITPVNQELSHIESAVPIGFEDERSYFDPLTQKVLDTIRVIPNSIGGSTDWEAFWYWTTRLLLQADDLTWISVWNSSLLSIILDRITNTYDTLLSDIHTGNKPHLDNMPHAFQGWVNGHISNNPSRTRVLEKLDPGNLDASQFWPRLRLISCWAHAQAQHDAYRIAQRFPNVRIQPKGLLATEGFISFPYVEDLSALSLNSHFFEFEDCDSQVIYLAHQLREGKTYRVIISTSGGLYRYALGDQIEVVSHYNQCPLIRFLSRSNTTVDLQGEKLEESYIESCIAYLTQKYNLDLQFWLMAPAHAHGYQLFIQSSTPLDLSCQQLQHDLETRLRKNFHYNYARQLGQLKPCQIIVLSSEANCHQVYIDHQLAHGQRLGDIKSRHLSPDKDWINWLH